MAVPRTSRKRIGLAGSRMSKDTCGRLSMFLVFSRSALEETLNFPSDSS
jgi:hypothetical protein